MSTCIVLWMKVEHLCTDNLPKIQVIIICTMQWLTYRNTHTQLDSMLFSLVQIMMIFIKFTIASRTYRHHMCPFKSQFFSKAFRFIFACRSVSEVLAWCNGKSTLQSSCKWYFSFLVHLNTLIVLLIFDLSIPKKKIWIKYSKPPLLVSASPTKFFFG